MKKKLHEAGSGDYIKSVYGLGYKWKMNKRLLHITLRAYVLYSLLILLIVAPLFYYATQRLYLKEADETLLLHKKEFEELIAPTISEAEIMEWNKFNRNRKINPAINLLKDSIYDIKYYDTLDAELEPYREIVALVTIQNKRYTYTDRFNLVESADMVKSVALLFLVTITLLLAGLFSITKRLSISIWKPFYKTLQQIESFEIDKTKQPVFLNSEIEEFDRLNISIEKLIERNILIYKSQQEFIENAAHELQTPLAVFQAKIDTLVQRSDTTLQQAEILDSLNRNVYRLNRLNKNLLLLFKMENDIYANKETISIAACVQKNLPFFTEQATAKNLSIEFDVAESFEISSNPVLADVLINNLFLNAIKHNIPEGKIFIFIKENNLTFLNSGLNNPLNTDKLFTRFSKANPSEDGTGLGLSIIKKIADLNSWAVRYNYENSLHSFSVSF